MEQAGQGRELPAWPVWILVAAALLAIAAFDLGPPVAFNDDWIYAWSVRHSGPHGISIHPLQSALALVQIGVGWLTSLGGGDQRLLRLSLLPFAGLASWSSWRLALRLGATRFWAAVAAAALLACPLYLTLATSFMSDVPYLALSLAAAERGANWVEDGQGSLAAAGLIALATLQRQVGLAIPAALSLALLVQAIRGRPMRLADRRGLAAVWLAGLAGLLLPALVGLAPAGQASRLADLNHVSPGQLISPLRFVPGVIGLALLPFAAALALRRDAPPRRVGIELAALAGLALVAALLARGHGLIALFAQGLGPFPGNIWTPIGFTPTSLAGPKPTPFPTGLWLTSGVASVVSFGLFLVWRWRSWRRLSTGGLTLALVALLQVVPLLLNPLQALDRYYLAAAAPLVPLAASFAGGAVLPRLAEAWALAALLTGLGVYAAGQQDYEAWQDGRDQAARLAYRMAPPDEVQAGYEANAVYVSIPFLDRTGKARERVGDTSTENLLLFGPPDWRYSLEYAPAGDPRPGAGYRSAASGRIVIVARSG